MIDKTVYQIQPGQVEKIDDIIALLDKVNADVQRSGSMKEMMLALGMVGATAALATSLLAKRNKIVETAVLLGAGTLAIGKGIKVIHDSLAGAEKVTDNIVTGLEALLKKKNKDKLK